MSAKWLHPNFLFPPTAPEYGVHPKAVFNQVITFCSRLAVSICGQVGEKKQFMYWNQENVDTVAALAESVPTVQPSYPIIPGEYPPPGGFLRLFFRLGVTGFGGGGVGPFCAHPWLPKVVFFLPIWFYPFWRGGGEGPKVGKVVFF